MDVQTILEGIKTKAAGANPLGKTLKFDFGEDKVYIDGTGDENVVSLDDKDADCLVIMSMADFISLNKGELNPMGAMMSGKIKIKGDMGVAMNLQSLLG